MRERLGQTDFRQRLLIAYDKRCAMTSYDAVDALEAAHIDPYAGVESNRISNGWPLRGDIHTLFDLNRIAINPETLELTIGADLMRTRYAELQEKKLRIPQDNVDRPDTTALNRRWRLFNTASG